MLRKAGIIALLISERCIHHALSAVGTLRSVAESASRQAEDIEDLKAEIHALNEALDELRCGPAYADPPPASPLIQ